MSRTASKTGVPGWYIEFLANVLRQLPRPDELDSTTAQGWNQNQKSLKKVLAEVLLPKEKEGVNATYKVVVDYSKSLPEMIKEGNYNWFNDDINDEYFPVQGAGQQEVELVRVHLNRNPTTKEVLEKLNSQGLEPAKIEHLLAFGATYSEIQREFPVVALGSVWVYDNGYRNYPYLRCYGSRCKLGLLWHADGSHWDGSCCFLAFRK